jgi:hypothetical protein
MNLMSDPRFDSVVLPRHALRASGVDVWGSPTTRRQILRLAAGALVLVPLAACAGEADDAESISSSAGLTNAIGAELAGVQIEVHRDPG